MTTTTPSSRKQSSDGDSRILKLGAVGGDFLDQRLAPELYVGVGSPDRVEPFLAALPASATIVTGCPTRTSVSCVSLKLAST